MPNETALAAPVIRAVLDAVDAYLPGCMPGLKTWELDIRDDIQPAVTPKQRAYLHDVVEVNVNATFTTLGFRRFCRMSPETAKAEIRRICERLHCPDCPPPELFAAHDAADARGMVSTLPVSAAALAIGALTRAEYARSSADIITVETVRRLRCLLGDLTCA